MLIDMDGDGCDDVEELINGSDLLDFKDDCDDSNVVDMGGEEDEGCVDGVVFCEGLFIGGVCSIFFFGAVLVLVFFVFFGVFCC